MDNYDEPKRSGTALKVVLIIITVIAVVAAVALGLLYYNATNTLEVVREKNTALSEELQGYRDDAAKYEETVAGYEQQIADLTKQLEEAQSSVVPPNVDGGDEEEPSKKPVVDLSGNKALSVKPDELYDAGVEYTVKAAGLNLRSGPNTTYKIITSVNKGDTVTAYAEDGDWYLVTTDGATFGWVKNSFVDKK